MIHHIQLRNEWRLQYADLELLKHSFRLTWVQSVDDG